MDDWDPVEDEFDWLTGKYSYKKERLRRSLELLENDDDILF